MEFGLQSRKPEVGSPVFIGNPRKRIEAKAYRVRDRTSNHWFRHDMGTSESASNDLVSSPVHSLPASALEQTIDCRNHLCCKCGIALPTPKTPKLVQQSAALQKQNREMLELQQRSGGPRLPLRDTKSPARARMHQQIFTNCKDWYRHEHTILVTSDDDEDEAEAIGENKGQGQQRQKGFLSPSWWPTDDQQRSSQPSPSPRRGGPEAEKYYRRNHDGSAKEWYRHDHSDDESPAPCEEEIDSEERENFAAVPLTECHKLCITCELTCSPLKDAMKRQKEQSGPRSRQALTKKFLAA